MHQKNVHIVSAFLAGSALAAGVAIMLAPRSRALAGDSTHPATSVRLIAIPENGSAILIDQSNRAWMLNPGALHAAPVLNDSRQQILVR